MPSHMHCISGRSSSSLPWLLWLSAASRLELREALRLDRAAEEDGAEPALKAERAEDNDDCVGDEGLMEESCDGVPLKLVTPRAPALPLLPRTDIDDPICFTEAAEAEAAASTSSNKTTLRIF